ncbi:MAG: FtsQ-type POTRA domain-containing protein [Acidimicrobiaceae bacterium]|nr:FtsQ-type POTRA domain-containing protein [Acidimicrobiaceae bacterium]MXZ98249.1 FtsQ-type POTRA domain-containing protein [Acidimicrobiaceae bacterium]MYE74866.1 FtsQ-type POTRA domain-containing protein [Acidimicrobiaceae bacterium]MYE96391.1 FtsQ-type POTRA domain-containing protein [Acidimicrobiaceae bacterium]MYH42359.1 FtsQ-type POTRA domain-containing protein [Acidimicrobiaceae bacterium]
MSAVTVDPRMKARRVAVLRAEGRRRLRILLVALGVALAAAAAWGVSLTPLLDVDRMAVSGADPAERAEIIESAQLSVGTPMVFLDVDDAQRSIAALPWVRSARVWRDWPATVRIAVERRVPAAVVPARGGRTALVDAHGYAIGWGPGPAGPDAQAGDADPAGGSPVAGLPHVSVPFSGRLGDIHTSADGPLAVVAAMPDDLRAWVETVTLEQGQNRMGLELIGGATAVLGDPVLIDAKVSALRAVLAAADLACITTIDVTMPDLATVTRHHPCRP